MLQLAGTHHTVRYEGEGWDGRERGRAGEQLGEIGRESKVKGGHAYKLHSCSHTLPSRALTASTCAFMARSLFWSLTDARPVGSRDQTLKRPCKALFHTDDPQFLLLQQTSATPPSITP